MTAQHHAPTQVLAAVLAASVPATRASAGEFLTRDELRSLVSGNTVHFEVAGAGTFKTYLDASGEATRIHDGQRLEGTWRINNDGALCVHYAGAEDLCGQVEENSDGTYTRVDDANVENRWTKISSGEDRSD